MNELHEELERIARDKTEFNIFHFLGGSLGWTVIIKKNADGVKLEVNANADNLAAALDEAVTKWKRITSGVNEFKGQLLELKPHDFDDNVPF